MINFFRKFRKEMAENNQFLKYSRYAIGEILLIVLGIFIALQLQNWNEKRKQEAQFKVTLEQLYNTIKFDTEKFQGESDFFQYKIEIIENVLYQTDSIPANELAYPLYLLTIQGNPYESESQFHVQNLEYNPNNIAQNEVVKEIVNYTNNIKKEYKISHRLKHILEDNNIAYPKLDFTNLNSGWITTDSTYYSQNDIINLQKMVRSDKLRAILKTLQTDMIFNKSDAKNRNGDGLSIMRLIKSYYPEVKIIFRDVGIIGTSINGYDDVGGKSTPMTLTDVENSIWQIDMYLKEGTVKFRCRDSWTQNWGGTNGDGSIFPKGIAEQDGLNIPIEVAGNYHISLNLITNTYEFKLLKETK
jgi:hypothetical protein